MTRVHTEFTSDPSKVERDLERLNQKYVALQEKMKGVAEGSKKDSDSIIVGLTKWAGAVGIASKAYDVFTDAIQANTQAKRDAADATRESEIGLRQLQQLADPNKAGDFSRLKGEAQKFFAAGGGQNLDEAARTVFSLFSAGAGDKENLALFANLSSSGLVEDVGQTAAYSKALISALGAEETGSFEDIVSKALAASAGSPSTADQILSGASRAGGAAKALGLTDEEVLTATAIAANITGSAEQAGTQVRAFAQTASTIPGLEGLNLQGIVQNIQGRGLDRGGLKQLLKTDEAIAAFDALSSNEGAYTSLLGQVDAAAGSQLAARQSALADTDPALAAARAARIAANQRLISEESLGVGTNAADALEDALITQLRAEGASGAEVYLKQKIFDLRRFTTRNKPAVFGGSGESEFVEEFLPFADEATQQRIRALDIGGAEASIRDRNAQLINETNQLLSEQNKLLKQKAGGPKPQQTEN